MMELLGTVAFACPISGDPVLGSLLALGVGAVVGWWGGRSRYGLPAVALPAAPPAESGVPEDAEDGEAADAPALPDVGEGPGPLLTRLQALTGEAQSLTEAVGRYSGTREVQVQQWQRTCADVLRRLVPVLDNLEPYLSDDTPGTAEVAQVTYHRLQTELATVGVVQIQPQAGEPVIWQHHQLAGESVGAPPFVVTAVVEVGYLFTPRIAGAAPVVLRPATVIGRGSEETAERAADTVASAAVTPEDPAATDSRRHEL
jgi:molecular chaperone GrpE (heat shock protein)